MTNTQRLFLSLATSILLVNFLLRQGVNSTTLLSQLFWFWFQIKATKERVWCLNPWACRTLWFWSQAKPTKERLCMVSESLALQKCWSLVTGSVGYKLISDEEEHYFEHPSKLGSFHHNFPYERASKLSFYRVFLIAIQHSKELKSCLPEEVKRCKQFVRERGLSTVPHSMDLTSSCVSFLQ